ncbi:MAG: ABC transporter ATP-binding protein [Bacteroidia bacterium]|nr:ABC transporter ATP-binding protein [Bacteroidia bacterium]
MRRTLRLIFSTSPRLACAVGFLVLCRGVMPVVMLWALKVMVDVTMSQIGQKTLDILPLAQAGILLVSIYVCNGVTASLAQVMRQRLSSRVSERIWRSIHKKSMMMDLSKLENAEYQNIFFRAVNESSSKPLSVLYSLCTIVQECITAILLGAVLISLHWSMPIAIVVIGLPLVLVKVRSSRSMFNLQRKQTKDERKRSYYSRILTLKEYAKEVRLFGLGELFSNRYNELQTTIRQEREALYEKNIRREALGQVASTLGVVSLAAIVVWRAIEGDLTAGSLALYFMSIQRGNATAQGLMSNVASLVDTKIYLRNLFDYLDIPVDKRYALPDKSNGGVPFPRPIKRGIEVRNVSFKYPDSKREAIKNVSFTVKPGETVALVGPNGSGKTTLVKLLCGLYRPTSGEILIDGVSINDLSANDISDNMSAIFQDFMLYNTSAAENINLGNIRTNATRDSVEVAAAEAGVDKLLASLPLGYDTLLGNLFEGSEMLSQGQWQRIALARSFYNKNAQIIFLDEPMASLDRETRKNLLGSFHKIMQDRTAIIVSHSEETIKMADQVIDLGVIND